MVDQTAVEHVDISVAEFLSVAIYLSEECGKIIRGVQASGDLKIKNKDDVSPVTIADITVQKTIEENLKLLYPTLNVQGEESKESTDTVDSVVSSDTITEAVKNFVTKDFLNNNQDQRKDFIEILRATYTEDEVSSSHFETFNTKDAVVWIDPLDGTSDFVKGNLPAVTVLIGLSVNNKSRAGIVHNPFSDEDQTVGKTIFGTAEHGAFKVAYDEKTSAEDNLAREIGYIQPFNHTEEPAEDHTVRVAASLSHFSAQIQQIIETIHPVEIVRLGGAGNKCCNLALGVVDAYIHPSPGLKYWDLCAPESLIKAMGGYSTTLYQDRLTYPIDGDRKIMGLILSKNPPMYDLIVKKRMGELLKTIVTQVKL